MIAELTLHLDSDAIEPGEQITGRVLWSAKVESLEVVLRWETAGTGDKDTAIVARAPIDLPPDQVCETRFALTAPEQPFSFAGTLISLTYYVRVEDSAGGVIEAEIVIAPGGKEVRLAGA